MLVFLVMFVFLQNWRATLIPTIAVPVVLLGTFGVLCAAGFSINTLTMFAHGAGDRPAGRRRHRGGRERRADDAARRACRPRRPPASRWTRSPARWSASALVLSAVFLPMAFFGGSTGVIYRQFSITIVSAMALSVLVALILTPALCATILKPATEGRATKRPASSAGSTATSTAASHRYGAGVERVIGRSGRDADPLSA